MSPDPLQTPADADNIPVSYFGPVPDTLAELKPYIADIRLVDENPNSDEMLDPMSPAMRKEATEKYMEATSRLESLNEGQPDEEKEKDTTRPLTIENWGTPGSNGPHFGSSSTRTPPLAGANVMPTPQEEPNPEITDGTDSPHNLKKAPARLMNGKEWENYLQAKYKVVFDHEAASLIQRAIDRSIHDRGQQALATQHLLTTLVEESSPLAGLRIVGFGRGYIGTKPPWHEDISTERTDHEYVETKGFKPFSRNLDQCLQEAAKLAQTIGNHRAVNPWYITFALIKLNPPGFSHFLHAGDSDSGKAAATLRANLRKQAPRILRDLPWHDFVQQGIAISPLPNLDPEDEEELKFTLHHLEIKVSFAVWKALNFAVAQCADVVKVNGYAEVGLEHLVAGLLTVGIDDELSAYAEKSLPFAMFKEWGASEDRVWELWESLRSKAAIHSNAHGWELSETLEDTLKRASQIRKKCTTSDEWVAARHLVAALLSLPSESTIKASLKSIGLDLTRFTSTFASHLILYEESDFEDEWRALFPDLFQPNPVNVTGRRFTPRREAAEDELCVNIDIYALAIAETFRAANDEDDFVFALYGRWGRGKSTLIARVADLLEKKSVESYPGYKAIFFSAWKYPSRPEVWVHLYETLVAAACKGGLWQKLRISFRVGILESGWIPIIGGFGLLMLSRLPVLDYAHWIFDGVGIAGLILLGTFIIRSTALGKAIANRYFTLPSHIDKLGLQAVVGEDLRRIVHIWASMPNSNLHEKKESGTANELGVPGAIDFECCSFGWRMAAAVIGMTWISAFLMWWRLPSLDDKNIWPFATSVGLIVALAISVTSLVVILCKKPQVCRKLLLIVDDLDRCDPSQMISIIESIRLFLDEDFITRRLQVAMLLDRSILCRVLERQGSQHGSFKPGGAEQFCREQEEKYFVASLHLSNLDREDVQNIVKNVIEKEYLHQVEMEVTGNLTSSHGLSSEPSSVQKGSVSSLMPGLEVTLDSLRNGRLQAVEKTGSSQQGISSNGAETTHREVVPDKKQESNANTSANLDISFEAPERKLLRDKLGEIDASTLTPRSIRSFVLRYQLARLLLQQLSESFDAAELVHYLAEKLYPNSISKRINPSPAVVRAVHAVTGYDE